MTILGKHTIAEIRDLMATIDFRVKAVFNLIAKVNGAQGAFTPGHPGVTSETVAKWNVWLNNWRNVENEVANLLTAIMISNPLVSASNFPAEDQWTKIRCAINKSCDDSFNDPGDMMSNILRIQNEAGEKIDERNHPQPDAGDPDFSAFLKVDGAIRAGEKAKSEAEKAAKGAATSNIGIAVIGAAIVIGGAYVATSYWNAHPSKAK